MQVGQVNPLFWRGKKVFLSGHTGFKGGWLSLWLASMGAEVTGYALTPNTEPNLYGVLSIENLIHMSHIADVKNFNDLQNAILKAAPDILIHMAAQPLVRYSYEHPVDTYATNVMGTVNILESARAVPSLKATVVVTTDKCYENKEWVWGYRENEAMGGYDPYSSSKGCAELVTAAYRKSYFSSKNSINSVASARAGNVIGGGDWSTDRLIPDVINAFEVKRSVKIRSPKATRPWQHVLEPLSGYLVLAQALYEAGSLYASGWNFGPHDDDNRSVQEVVDLMISQWGEPTIWEMEIESHPHEAGLLKLDCSKAHQQLGWAPKWDLEMAVQKIIEWQKAFLGKVNMQEFSLSQINQYMNFKR